MKEKLISIIVPIYNAALTLKRCIDSIRNQTFSHLEIILVNDGSTDNSLDICNSYKVTDNRITVIDKINSGVSEARNDGIRKSSGKYLLFVDADDYIDLDYVETLYSKLSQYKVDIVVSNAINFNSSGVLKSIDTVKHDTVLNNFEMFKELFSEESFHSVCWGKLFARDAIREVIFDKQMRIAEDFKFINDVFGNVNKALIIPERKYHYLIRDGSATRSGFDAGWVDEIKFCREIINKHKDTSLEKYAVKRYMRVLIDSLYRFNLDLTQRKMLKAYTKGFVIAYLTNKEVNIKYKVKYFISLVRKNPRAKAECLT